MEQNGSRFKLHFQQPILAHNFKAKDSRATLDIRHPGRNLPSHASTKHSYYIEAKNPPNLTGQIKKTGESVPIYKEAEKTENVSGRIHFSLVSKGYIGAPQFSLNGYIFTRTSESEALIARCNRVRIKVRGNGLLD
jgi:hypothetical protein